jgi:hypothetical protein
MDNLIKVILLALLAALTGCNPIESESIHCDYPVMTPDYAEQHNCKFNVVKPIH